MKKVLFFNYSFFRFIQILLLLFIHTLVKRLLLIIYLSKECSENNMLIFHDRTKKEGRVET